MKKHKCLLTDGQKTFDTAWMTDEEFEANRLNATHPDSEYVYWTKADEGGRQPRPRFSIHSEYPENAALTITTKKGNDRLYIERLISYLSDYLESET